MIFLVKKYIFYILLLLVIVYQQFTITSLNDDKTSLRESVIKAETINETLKLKYAEQIEKAQDKYEKDIKDLHANYSVLNSQLDVRLSNINSKIRENVQQSNNPDSVRTTYIDRYQQVFSECTREYSKVARDLGTVGLERDLYKYRLDNIYKQVEEFNKLNSK